MAKTYKWRFHVRSYEVDPYGFVRASAYINYLEEVAIQASESLGYGYDWYFEQQRMWLVRKLILNEITPARINDDLILSTWIGESRRVQVNREYELRRASDNALLLRGRHNWVFVNLATLLPERLPPELTDKFKPTNISESIDVGIPEAITPADVPLYTEMRRVEYHELDQNKHVNNAVYVGWVEQALTHSLREIGWPPDRLLSDTLAMRRVGREIEYFRSALDDEPMRITTRLDEVGIERAVWLSEIWHADSNELIARDRTVFAFSNANGACGIPDELYSDLTSTALATTKDIS